MSDWKEVLAPPGMPITDAIRLLDRTSKQILLIVDDECRLLGAVTDGDIRRGILKSVPLSEPVSLVMNSKPTSASRETTRDARIAIMRKHKILQLPIIDDGGRVCDLALLDPLAQHDGPLNWVVLMAGGLGTRLRPLTEDMPKPLLKIGSKPLLEIILDNLIRQGFQRFYIAVNYLADMIKDHLGDGSQLGVEIRYLHETTRLGTAGPLSLLPEVPTLPVVVMNGDLLTKADIRQLLAFHTEHNVQATLAVRDYEFQVPYGVVRVDDHRIVTMDEKPIHHFFVNAGIYVLEPEVVAAIPKGTGYDMPDVFRRLMDDGRATAAFPLREYWLDIGRLDDFARANDEFSHEFQGE